MKIETARDARETRETQGVGCLVLSHDTSETTAVQVERAGPLSYRSQVDTPQ